MSGNAVAVVGGSLLIAVAFLGAVLLVSRRPGEALTIGMPEWLCAFAVVVGGYLIFTGEWGARIQARRATQPPAGLSLASPSMVTRDGRRIEVMKDEATGRKFVLVTYADRTVSVAPLEEFEISDPHTK